MEAGKKSGAVYLRPQPDGIGENLDDATYASVTEELFLTIEDTLDEIDLDLDVDVSGGLLTISFENGTTVVVSRQVANKEIWVAARSGGFHLAHNGTDWVCGTTGETLPVLLDRVFSEQSGETVSAFSE